MSDTTTSGTARSAGRDGAPAAAGGGSRGRGVVAVTGVTLGLVYGFWYAYSVFFVAFLREFGWNRSVVAGIFSLLVLVHGVSGPWLGWLCERFGARRVILAGGVALGGGLLLAAGATRAWHLYLALGVIAAAGLGAAGWVPAVALVRGWFPDRVGTAVGLASAGIGIGIAAIVPATQLLIEAAGWRWAMRVLALLILGWVVPATAWLVRDPPRRDVDDPAPAGTRPGAPHWTLAAATRSGRFWGMAAAFASASGATQMLLAHQVAYLVDHRVPGLVAAGVVSVVGLASVVGKAGWGALSDRAGREPAYTAALGCVLASIGALALAGVYPGSVLPYVYATLIGVGYAATAPLTPAVASDLFGGPRFARIFGTVNVANSVGGAVGAWAGGWIFDWRQSYALALWGAAALTVLAPTVLWVVAPRRPNPPPGAHR